MLLLLFISTLLLVCVYSQSDTSLYLVDYGFGLNLWSQLPSGTDPSSLVASLTNPLQTIQNKSIDGKAFNNLLQVLKSSSTDTLFSDSNYSTNDITQLITARNKLLTTDQLRQTDASNIDNTMAFFSDKPQIIISKNMDWNKWNAYYAKCVLLIQKDPTKVDDVRRFLAGWLDNGGDVPSTTLFDGGNGISTTAITTTAAIVETLGSGSSEPPGVNDLFHKMKQVGTGNDANTNNLIPIYVFVVSSLVIHLVF